MRVSERVRRIMQVERMAWGKWLSKHGIEPNPLDDAEYYYCKKAWFAGFDLGEKSKL